MPAEAPTTTSASATGGKRCPKCGKGKKSGKLSCCARGGAWFQKCGDGDDSKFDHTWVEGIQACNSLGSHSTEAPAQVMLRQERVTVRTTNATWTYNSGRQQSHKHSIDDMTDYGTADVEGSIKIELFAMVLFVIMFP